MAATSDLHLLEDEWEVLDNVPLSFPSNINEHLVNTKVSVGVLVVLVQFRICIKGI